MMNHPTPFELEAWHEGSESDLPVLTAHVEACGACAAYLGDLDRRRQALLDRERPGDFARRMRARAEETRSAPSPWLPRLWGGMIVAAVAAAVLFVAPPGERATPAPTTTRTAPGPTTGPEPVRLKGADVRVALIVLRDGVQRRHTRPVALLPGDRIRLELSLTEPGTVVAGILVDDGTWVAMMEPSPLNAGTHVLDRTMTVDASAMQAMVVAGPPDAIAALRLRGDLDGLATLSVATEIAP